MRYPAKQRWASAADLLALPPRQAVTPDDLAARAAIGELYARYGIAHDEIDLAAMGDVFTEGGVLEVSIGGPVFERHTGRAAIVNNFARVTATQSDQRRHAISNVEVTMAGPAQATSRAYGLVSAANGETLNLVVSCAYTADLIREADGLWRFARLWIGMDDYAGKAPGTQEGGAQDA
ncbi:hypothetical protein AQS8620_00883 [Aquimixticola soesokkakensis]|uniref:SnoaL-like domain-containing protein n=1 Tax=Aquimixticola soesokkakensis TaxID=1519096 RepID=A0A1Y5RXZ2_9RHOB|nr:nuclear transport factor 2 family protein [Aquimixticola soesokkakensis]SLN28219.1 hypothetical protein AQS8620_00883 [Aquimixticola soesokkakensis]